MDAGTIKLALAEQIRRGVRERSLTQQEAALVMGLSQPRVCRLLAGNVASLSERKLMDCLRHLGYDVKITVSPAGHAAGQLTIHTKEDARGRQG